MDGTEVAKRVAERLCEARKQLGLTQLQAAQETGIGREALANMEIGKRNVRAVELAALARVYGRDISAFLLAEVEQQATAPILWRAQPSAEDRARARGLFLRCLDAYSSIEKLAGIHANVRFSPKRLSNLDYSVAKWLASVCGREYELGARPAHGLECAMEDRIGVKVITLDGLPGGVSAAATLRADDAAVLLNADEVPWRRSFSLAHELFHLLTWDVTVRSCDVDPIPDDDTEKFAQCFAAELLMPEGEFRREMGARLEGGQLLYSDLAGIARSFGVSAEAVVWRVCRLKYIAEDAAKAVLESREFRFWNIERGREERPHVTRPSGRFVALGFHAMQNGRLSRAKFASHLEIALPELDRFLLKCGLSEEEDESVEIPAT